MKKGTDNIKKVLLWKPKTGLLAVVSGLTLLLLLLPLIRITLYCTPWYDDYACAGVVKNFLEQKNSLGSALEGTFYCIRSMWWAWQGTFSSIFFMALVPYAWNDSLYFAGLVALILLTTVSVLTLGKVLLRDVLGCDRASCAVLSVLTTVLVLELMHTSRSGFFWYNSGIHYVGMHSFLLLFVAGMVKLLVSKSRAIVVFLTIVSILGAVLASGANFVTALQGMLIAVFLVGAGAFLKKKRAFLLLPALVVYAYGFYKNVSAPGNAKRGAYFAGYGMEPVQAVLQSFAEAFKHLWTFTGWMTILILILAAPVIWKMTGKISYRFRLPGVVLALAFCLYATGFTPSLYSLGHAGLGRTLNAVKITFQILLVINEFYWLGWLRRTLELRGRTAWQGECCWWAYLIVMAAMFTVFWFTPSREGIYSSWGAYHFVHTGEAYNYYQEYLTRVIIIKSSGPDVTVPPYNWNPWLIRMGELSEDPNAEQNVYMAEWYRKNSIACIPEDASE